MWVFLPSGPLSIVQYMPDKTKLMVRARRAEDITALFPYSAVGSTPLRDYQYRAIIPRLDVAMRLTRFVMDDLNYSNFKDSIPKTDSRYIDFAMRTWSEWLLAFTDFKERMNALRAGAVQVFGKTLATKRPPGKGGERRRARDSGR